MRKYEPHDLYEWIYVEATIECSNCDNTDTCGDEDCEYFFNKGWRATGSNVYCPICAVRKLSMLPQIKSTKKATVGK